MLWRDNSAVLTAFVLLFMASYVLLYCRILKLKTPKWLMIRRSHERLADAAKAWPGVK